MNKNENSDCRNPQRINKNCERGEGGVCNKRIKVKRKIEIHEKKGKMEITFSRIFLLVGWYTSD